MHRPILDEFENYIRIQLVQLQSKEQMQELQKAFYGGSLYLLTLMRDISSGKFTKEEEDTIMNNLFADIDKMVEEFMSKDKKDAD